MLGLQGIMVVVVIISYANIYYIVYIFVYFTHCYDLFTDDKSTVTMKQEVSLPGIDLCSISVSLS